MIMVDNSIRRNGLIASGHLVCVVSLLAVVFATQEAARSCDTPTRSRFNVKDFGARGNGEADDTPAIQNAIDAAHSNPDGGEVVFPKGTYLLDSTSPSTHPWAYYNLQIESGVILRGEEGAKLLQGPQGRHPVLDEADGVRNSILAFGSDHQIIRFQYPNYNGGFYSLNSTSAASTIVTLKTPAESSKFKPGDYVAIYEKTEGDVIPTETGRIVSLDAVTGQLTLGKPLSRSFQTPSIANVTHVATTNVGVKNLVVEGSEPLTVTETFGFVAEDCHFINDTSIGGKNVVDFNMNTLNGFRFSRNRFTSIGLGHIVLEMTQRNSRHGVWDDNTIEMMQGGMGEYAADIQFLNNTFNIHPTDKTSVGLMIGGQNIVFRGNKVTCGPITGGEGWGCVLADCVGPGYDRYVGNITIEDNTFIYQGNGNQLTHLVARDTSFTGNTVTVKGSSMGVRGEGPPPQHLTITNNTFRMGTGHAVFLASHGVDGSTVTDNTIIGSGTQGIYVASPDKPNAGKHVIRGNRIDGYRSDVFIDGNLHPGTILAAKEQKPEIRVERDIVYGTVGDVKLRLNLALPAEGKGPFPAVVCIHGGGWFQGHRQDMDPMIELLARRGYAAVTVSYRLAPDAQFPAQIEDCKAAVRWLRANAGKYHINSSRIGAIGPSAGGHLACLLGVTDRIHGLEGTGGNPEQHSRVQAVVSFFGRTNFTKKTWSDDLEKKIFVPLIGASFQDKPEWYKRISPIEYSSSKSPPFLLFHGAEDSLVPPENSADMAEKLRAAGASARVVSVEGEGHGSGDWIDKWATHVDQAVAFFDKHLKK